MKKAIRFTISFLCILTLSMLTEPYLSKKKKSLARYIGESLVSAFGLCIVGPCMAKFLGVAPEEE